MTRIGFDLFELATYPFRGIARYEHHLARALISLETQDEFVFFSPPCKSEFLTDLSSSTRSIFKTVRLTLRQRKLVWMASNLTRVPLDRLVGSVKVFHAPDFVGPWLSNTPLVITVHDLAPWLYPETRTGLNLFFYRTAFPISARRAARIIAVSESTSQDLCKWLPRLEEKIITVHESHAAHYTPQVDSDVFKAVQSRLGVPDRYILSVGTLEPRKNYPMLLEAFSALINRGAEWDDVRLVIVGKAGWRYEKVLSTMSRLGLSERVVITDSLTDQELCQLYIHCSAFVLPSFYEGFGLPVVEAMACGAPVIISTAAALTEVAGGAALAVDPHCSKDLVAALCSVMQDPQKQKVMRGKSLERAALFSWERAARETRRVYEEAVQSWCGRRACCT